MARDGRQEIERATERRAEGREERAEGRKGKQGRTAR